MKYKEPVSSIKHSPGYIVSPFIRRRSGQFFSCDRAIIEALKVFLVHRLILSIVGIIFGLLVLHYFPHPWAESPAYLKPNTEPLLSLLVAPWQRWDSEHYLQIAAQGYNNQDGNTVFAPLFPLLVSLVGRLLFSEYMLAGLLVANFAYFGMLVYFYKLANHLFDAMTARYSLRLVAFFPTAFFLLCAYTEAL